MQVFRLKAAAECRAQWIKRSPHQVTLLWNVRALGIKRGYYNVQSLTTSLHTNDWKYECHLTSQQHSQSYKSIEQLQILNECLHPRILHSVKLSIKCEERIIRLILSGSQKNISHACSFKKILKDVLSWN